MAIDLLATLKLKDDFTKPLGRAEKGIGSFGSSAKKLTGIVAGIGLGAMATGFAKDVAKTGISFTESMSNAAAVTKATGAQYEELKSLAMDMGQSTVFSASEAADGISYLGMAGFKTNEIVAALPDTLSLAAAGGLDLARAADIASNVMSGFNMMSGDVAANMKRTSDVMAAAASSANTDVNQLGDAMSYAAPVAAAYGISLEESAATVGIFSNAGIQGSRAGMALKNSIAQLANPVGKTSKKLAELGLSAADVNPEVNSLSDILETLEGAGVKATDAISLVGTEAGPGFASLISMGSEELKKYTKELENSEGAAQAMADIMVDNLGGDIKMLGSMWETFKLELFFKQEGFMRDVIQGITRFVEKLVEAIPVVENFISENKTLFKGLAIGAGILVGVIGAIVGINLALIGLSMLASPVGLVVLAIMGLGVAFMAAYEHIEPFRNAVGGVIDKAKELYNVFKEEGLGAAIREMVPEGMFDSLAEKMGRLVERFSGYGEKLGEFWESLKEIFTKGAEAVGGVLSSLWGVIGPVISVIAAALQIVGDIAMWAFEFVIIPLAGLVMSIFSAMWTILGPILELFGAALGVVGEVALWLWDNAIKPLAEYLGGEFKGFIETATKIVDKIGGAFEGVSGKVETLVGWVKDFAGLIKNIKVPDWVTSAAGGVMNFVTGGGGKGHFHGIDDVPYDGYSATLHRGERVLTAQENRAYSGKSGGGKGGGRSVQFGDIHLHGVGGNLEEAADKLLYIMAQKIEREGAQMA